MIEEVILNVVMLSSLLLVSAYAIALFLVVSALLAWIVVQVIRRVKMW